MPEPAFQWLRDEVTALKASRFHLFDRAVAPSERGASDPMIASFLTEFGAVRLYREGTGHRISLHWPRRPESEVIRSMVGDLLEFGVVHGESIYVGPQDSTGACLWKLGSESGKPRSIRHPFDVWLKRAGVASRRLYSLEDWRDMALDPKPFTAQELERLAARKLFEWTVERLPRRKANPSWVRTIAIEVTNRSTLTLPYLTIGYRWSGGASRIFVDVSRFGPGVQRRIVRDVDSGGAALGEFFAVEDPLPEERDILWDLIGAGPNQDPQSPAQR